MTKTLYLIGREFREESGSYSKFFKEVSRYAKERNYKVKILCAKFDGQKQIEYMKDYTVRRFPISTWTFPPFGSNLHYLNLTFYLKDYLESMNYNPEKDIIICNHLACLGLVNIEIKGKKVKYGLRIGQPADIKLKAHRIANEQLSMITKMARFFHLKIQKHLEAVAIKEADIFLFPSEETKDFVFSEYLIKKPYIIPYSGVEM